MLDLSGLENYKENNRLEAKKAANGLPKSLWETYSAFANTTGGIILLGVSEDDGKNLHVTGVTDPHVLLKEFWDTINNQQKVSVNILTDRNVVLTDIDGKSVISISVPAAQRHDKPIYVGNNPLTGTYRRNGEGDYRCQKEDVRAMLRDASAKTQDSLTLEDMSTDVFDQDSIKRYRMRMRNSRPGHVWEGLENSDFLYRLGAAARGGDGLLHPTNAGLLMFGQEYEITKEFPYYFLDYREQFDPDNRWTDRITSSSADWSGNLYDFYFRVYNKLSQSLRVPFKLEDGIRVDDTPMHKAVREAVVNCLVNADYYGTRGVVIVHKRDEIRIENPGRFRISLSEAKSGGISDPRNPALMKMFNLIDIGERAGSGIPAIYSAWGRAGQDEPTIEEKLSPDRVVFILGIVANNEFIGDNKKIGDKIGDNKKIGDKIGDNKKIGDKIAARKSAIYDFIKEHGCSKTAELSDMLNLKPSRTRDYLSQMVRDGVLAAEGNGRNRTYHIASLEKE